MNKRTLIINHRKSDNPKKLEDFFSPCDVVHHTMFKKGMEKGYKQIVLSGGSVNIRKLKDEMELIKNERIPIIAICLGMQLVSYAYGNRLYRLKKKRRGHRKFTLNGNERSLYYNHLYTIREDKLQGNFKVMNSTNVGNNPIILQMEHKEKPILCFQGHPEFAEKEHKQAFKEYCESWYNRVSL